MVKKYDVIVVGELNVDLILNDIECLPVVGKEVLAQRMTMTLGSSSAIFASNLSNLGVRVAFIGKLGRDKFGEIVLESLKQSKVDTSLIIVDENLNTGATVILNVDEDRANVTYPGAMDHLTIDDIAYEDLKEARHLHFSSCFLQPGIKGDLVKLFKSAKQLGLSTSFDMQWDPSERWDLNFESLLPYVDVFLPNENELSLLTGKNDLHDAIDAIKHLTNVLVVKRGNRGSVVYHQNNLTDMPSFLNESVVDAIGAGDSFNAGFISRYIDHQSIESCQRFGNLTGAISTTMAGGTKAFEDSEYVRKIAIEKFGVEI